MSGHLTPPFEKQRFDNFQDWVNKASSWLTSHPQYNNTEHRDNGLSEWRGHHFTALCFDAKGRRCRIGSDFMKAQDEGTFPVWWVWPDQIPELVDALQSLQSKQSESA